MEENEWAGEFGALERVTFMSDLLNKQIEIRNTLDLRTNIMIGFNSALIVFFATSFQDGFSKNLFFVLALIAVGISMVCAILALKPSHFATKKGRKESLFYHHEIDKKSAEEYRHEILETLADENKVYDEYILEVYNLTRYSNVPRKFYLNWSIRILFYGIMFSLALYAITLLPAFLAKFIGY